MEVNGQMQGMMIREARHEDAVRACEVMRRSIAELCGSDHHNDPAVVARWLANKTPENFAAWIADEDNRMFVAVEQGDVLAVGAVRTNGEITLNYVSPDARFRGVSRAMLAQLEATAQAFGNDTSHLISTETARRFYLAAGYQQVGVPEGKFGTTSSYPMLKRFSAADERS
jgi:GNAT superfamily N-acetyltransferase